MSSCFVVLTIEQSVIPGGSNDERLTDVDTRNATYAK